MRNVASKSSSFASFFFRAYPARTTMMVVLLVVAGFAESFGVLALVPILEIAERDGAAQSPVGLWVADLLRRLGQEPTLGSLLLLVMAAVTLKSALLALAARQAGYTMAQVSRDLRLRLMGALLFARWNFFGEKPIGRYAGAIGAEVNRTAAAYREGCQVIAALVQIAAYLVVSAFVAWKITLGTMVIGVAMTLLFIRFFRSSRAAGVAQTRHNKALTARLVDVLQGLKPLKAMGREPLVWPLLERETEALSAAQRRVVDAAESRNFLYEPLVTAILAGGLFVVLGIGGQPLPQVLVLAFIFYRIMQHVNTLQMRYQTLLTGEGAFVSLVDEIAEAESAREERAAAPAVARLRERLEVRDVWFSYGTHHVLRGVNLEIPAGSFITLAGPSGSGKTTLADVLTGLRAPERGEVVVDGVPLRELDPASWRRTIGYVPQEMLVFNDTITRNVSLGDPAVTEADIEEALKLAGAWEFVQARLGGIHAEIGERGSSLSGGQRQRIAIARALVWRPSLLILDEVTTALDPATEQAICNTLRGLAGGTTIVAISHQRALREAADRTYVLRQGRVVPADTAAVAT
ncbi:ABC transporter ATP-binding protein [soil metagenome]